jgi:hypothetical protein
MDALAAGLDPGALIQPAIDAVQSGLTSVAGPALLVGAGVLALGVGWKFAKRFVKG